MVVVVLDMFTMPLILVCRGHLAFVLVMRTARRLTGAFLIVFLVDVLGAVPGRFSMNRMTMRVHVSVPFIYVVF
jgi:hypothetical protein